MAAICSLHRGISSIAYIDALLIMEDDLDEDDESEKIGKSGNPSSDTKLCLDSDVLKLCIRYCGDIRNDREDTRTGAIRKSAYR